MISSISSFFVALAFSAEISSLPGRAIEAISQVGRRLEQWNLEPEPTMAAYNLYGLVPGEERLFANAILLRLTDAFMTGERDIKLAVVRAFVGLSKSERKKRRMKKGRKIKDGILSKGRVSNSSELLRRVKVVFDGGDAESRAMALVLFGCWADFAKDSANIRYLILSNLVSSDVAVVKAALFAAGCFCELSSDFASVVLEMLVNLVTSPDVPLTARWAGVRTFSRMQCSYAVADRAYKTGRKLVSESSDEAFLVKMLYSISKLAGSLSILAFEQVNLLCSFLGHGKSIPLQEASLRCLNYMVKKGVCHFTEQTCMNPLLRIVDDPELPAFLQCEAVAILHQILLSVLPTITRMNKMEFDQLLTCILTASQCPVESKSLLALRCLADLCIRLTKGLEMGSATITPSLSLNVASLLLDRIVLLVQPLSNVSQIDSKIFVEVRAELRCLLHLVGKHPNLVLPMLDKLNLLIRHLINDHENPAPSTQEGSLEEKCKPICLKIMVILYKYLVACLDFLNEINAITLQVFEKIKILIQGICGCKLFSLYIQTLYSLLLHSRLIWNSMVKEDEEINENLSYDYWIESEVFTLMCAQKMLIGEDYWLAYKCGMLAASHGAWFTATFIFGNLMTKVRSHSCCCWLKSLAQLSLCEMKIQLLVLPTQELRSTECLELIKLLPDTLFEDGIGEVENYVGGHTNIVDYGEKLVCAYSYLNSSWETLKSCITTSGQTFCFQAWFLALRVKMLGIVSEAVTVLAGIPSNRNAEGQKETQISMHDCFEFSRKFTQLSARLKRLSEEFDLIAASFIDIDWRSSKIVSTLALGCSLLSFAAGFALFFPNLPPRDIVASEQENVSQATLVQNLFGRLCHIDHETSVSLSSLAEVDRCPKSFHGSHFQPRALGVGCEIREVLSLCRNVVSRVLHLQNQAKESCDEEVISQVTENGQQLLLDIITGLMRVPFQTPEYYFRTRPCMGSELFVVNADTKLSDGIFVSPGLCLSLNICIQLRNVPPNLLMQPIKLHCIICCNLSFQEPVVPRYKLLQCASRSWETDDMLILNEELYQHVMRRAEKYDKKHGKDSHDGKASRAFLSFEVSERGQGFSTCFLDVSRFPAGTYRMKWHSCCVDSRGSYWSLLPLNAGPVFTIR
ncbi:hypothetical protein CDL15_Pgr019816 [Punica granatum]|uniref:Integrator complex subunit 7 n=1 Tax=Punica granatum TaxID=22663 RepID=A0A218X793_PUNGR|nr:hypothetical protein CDL15_Pgr019816 [Punica granatum]